MRFSLPGELLATDGFLEIDGQCLHLCAHCVPNLWSQMSQWVIKQNRRMYTLETCQRTHLINRIRLGNNHPRC